jgi:hypothetical protein
VNEDARLWHVTVTLSGATHDPDVVSEALSRLAEERPFLHALRYASSTAEISYWEQAEAMVDAASLALRVWNEHRGSAGLPDWQVVGLEVLERNTFRRRAHESAAPVVGLHDARPRPL